MPVFTFYHFGPYRFYRFAIFTNLPFLRTCWLSSLQFVPFSPLPVFTFYQFLRPCLWYHFTDFTILAELTRMKSITSMARKTRRTRLEGRILIALVSLGCLVILVLIPRLG